MNALEVIGRPNFQSLKNDWVKHQVNLSNDNYKYLDWNSLNPFLAHVDALFPVGKKTFQAVEYEYTQIDNHSTFDFACGSGTGQYNFGEISSQLHCDAIIDVQRDLKDRHLSDKVDQTTVLSFAEQLTTFLKNYTSNNDSLNEDESFIKKDVESLISWILNDRISVYQTLDSGFWYDDIHYWSVGERIVNIQSPPSSNSIQHVDSDTIIVYVSLKHPSIIEAVLGTFLSLNGLSQLQTLLVEMKMNGGQLPHYVEKQISTSTPFELLTLIHLTEKNESLIAEKIRHVCEFKLVHEVEIEQILHFASNDLITGKMTIQEFLIKKLNWFCPEYLKSERPDYSIDDLALLFKEINALVKMYMLNSSPSDSIPILHDFLSNAYATAQDGAVDSRIGIIIFGHVLTIIERITCHILSFILQDQWI